MTNQEVVTLYGGLMSLYGNESLRFPAKVSFAIMRNLRMIESIAQDVISARMKILETYADPIPDSLGSFKAKKGQEDILNKELRELDMVENNLDFYTITTNDLEGLDLSLSDIDTLFFMISGES